jgi:hypothetical protein
MKPPLRLGEGLALGRRRAVTHAARGRCLHTFPAGGVLVLQEAFSTASLSLGDWLLCAAVASSVLWLREVSKLVVRSASPGQTARIV